MQNNGKLKDTNRNSNHVWHVYKYYPFLFQENLYTKQSTKIQIDLNNNTKELNSNFIKIKRLITKIRYQTYFQKKIIRSFGKEQKEDLAYLTIKPTLFLLNNIFVGFQKKNWDQPHSEENHPYNSIQTALVDMEYNWGLHGNILEHNVYSCLHPEIILRILREKMYDTSLFHFLRYILHFDISELSSKNCNFSIVDAEKLSTLLFNLYLKEFDKLFTLKHSKSLIIKKYSKSNRNYNISCVKKINKWDLNKLEIEKIYAQDNRKSILPYLRNPFSYKYIRTKNIWLLDLKSTRPLIQIIQQRYINFLGNRLGYITKHSNIRYLLSKNHTILLGYQLHFKIQEIFIRIQGFSCSLSSCVTRKSIVISNPLLFIIRILKKYRFCNFLGYPISKSGWATLSDIIIISRFKSIRDSLITYYKGCINQKDLSRIQHILHYSCAKTLACKHKTNLRKVWKKYSKNISIRDPYTHKKIFFDIPITTNKSKSTNKHRFWNLYLKAPDPISILLENTYKLKYYLNN